jgi:hypothetical protein
MKSAINATGGNSLSPVRPIDSVIILTIWPTQAKFCESQWEIGLWLSWAPVISLASTLMPS